MRAPLPLLVVLTFFIAVPLVSRPLFKRKEVQELAGFIQQSFISKRNGSPDLHIAEVTKRYLALSLTNTSDSDWTEMKYMVSHWRDKMTEEVISRISTANVNDLAKHLDDLYALKPQLRQNEIDVLLTWAEQQPYRIYETIALHGEQDIARKIIEESSAPHKDELLRILGPKPVNKYKPYFAHGKIRGLAIAVNGGRNHTPAVLDTIDAYHFIDEHTIRTRGGQVLRTGDYLAGDLNRPGDGTLNSFIHEKTPFGHAGLFSIIEVTDINGKQRRVPIVLEMHEAGNRIVPLTTFLAQKHIFQMEAFRLEDRDRAWHDEVARQVVLMTEGAKITYDFKARSTPNDGTANYDTYEVGGKTEKQHCATCFGLPELIYKRTDIALAETPDYKPVNLKTPLSKFTRGGLKNVSNMGFDNIKAAAFSANVLRGAPFERVAVFDNRTSENFARELIIGDHEHPGSATYPFSHNVLDLGKLSLTGKSRLPQYEAIFESAEEINEERKAEKTKRAQMPFTMKMKIRWHNLLMKVALWKYTPSFIFKAFGFNPDEITRSTSADMIALYLTSVDFAEAGTAGLMTEQKFQEIYERDEPLSLKRSQEELRTEIADQVEKTGSNAVYGCRFDRLVKQ